MCICNDRRWPETYRVMGLKGVELVLVGYNTPRHNPPAPEHDRLSEFHNQLSLQAGAYANATWVVGVAKCGVEEGCEMIGNSSVVAPSGVVVAQALSQDDELLVARCDLDLANSYKATTFNFAKHRQAAALRRDRGAHRCHSARIVRTSRGANMAYDLILKGGHVVDASQNIDAVMDVAFAGGKVAAVGANLEAGAGTSVHNVAGKYVTPGLIDLHTHVYWGGTSLGIDAEEFCRRSGVTTAIDTGSAGRGNFAGFRKHVIEP